MRYSVDMLCLFRSICESSTLEYRNVLEFNGGAYLLKNCAYGRWGARYALPDSREEMMGSECLSGRIPAYRKCRRSNIYAIEGPIRPRARLFV